MTARAPRPPVSAAAREVIRLFLNQPERTASVRKSATPRRTTSATFTAITERMATVHKAIPKRPARRPSATRTGDPFRDAVRAVPGPTESASLAEAFDAAKATYDGDPRYGTPLAIAPRGVTKNTTGSTFADVVSAATRKASL